MTTTTATKKSFGGLIVMIMVLNVMLFSFFTNDVSPPSSNNPNSSRRTMTTVTLKQTTDGCSKLLDEQDVLWNTRRRARQTSEHKTNGDREFFDLYEPEALCFSEERFGLRETGKKGGTSTITTRYQAFGDGPKFVCGVDLLASKNGDCLVYSVGSSNHIDFELSVKTLLGCEVHTFDPTLSRPFVGGNYSTFHPWGLGQDGMEHTFRGKTFTSKSLQTIYRELGHFQDHRNIDILKIDCESCEWTIMPTIFASIAAGDLQVSQIQIELHNYGDVSEENLKSFFEAADAAKMRIFHKERNQWGCKGFKCLEYAFVSESFLRQANARTICPKRLS